MKNNKTKTNNKEKHINTYSKVCEYYPKKKTDENFRSKINQNESDKDTTNKNK